MYSNFPFSVCLPSLVITFLQVEVGRTLRAGSSLAA